MTRLIWSLLVCLIAAAPAAADSVTLEVSAGDHDRQDSLVSMALPKSLQDHRHFALTRTDNSRAIPVQLQPGKTPSVVWILRDKLSAGKIRQYRLAPATNVPATDRRVTVHDDGKRLTVRVGKKPVLVYNQAVVPSPDAEHPYYAKSGYIHPVYNPSGQIVTDDFNPDHAHQHGIMFAWRKTTFEGRSTDGWDQQAGTGKVEHVELIDLASGPVFGVFTVRLHQVDLTAPNGTKPVLDEIWRVRVYGFRDRFLFDIDSTQTCASNVPVVIEKMHYGGLMIRGHADWQEHKTFDYLTSEGRTKTDGNHSRPNWVDLSGPVAGQVTGVTILNHPGNFRSPQPVRLHPAMPYFCFAPAVLGSFTIKPGDSFVSKYRFCVHDNKIDTESTDRLWRDYAQPPQVRTTLDP
jgi:hypothetical protein